MTDMLDDVLKTLNKDFKAMYGYKLIERESSDRILKMIDFLKEYNILVDGSCKETLKLNLISKLNNMSVGELRELKIFMENETARCKETKSHIHRYKYKVNLSKLVSRIYIEKLKENI